LTDDLRLDKPVLKGSLSAEETLLELLRISEMLIRQAPDPWPPLVMASVLNVYRMEVGYDLTADPIVPLIVPSIKVELVCRAVPCQVYCQFESCNIILTAALSFTILLGASDQLGHSRTGSDLYCLMILCRMPHVAVYHTDKTYPNRSGRHPERWYGISESEWISN
jgi:hypothetical protein